MNWVKAYNLAEAKCNEQVYNKCCNVQKISQEFVDMIYEKVCEKFTLDYLKDKNVNENKIEVMAFIYEQMAEHISMLYDKLNDIGEFLNDLHRNILMDCKQHLPQNSQQFNLMLKRACLTVSRVGTQLKYFIRETISTFGDDVDYYIEMMFTANEELGKYISKEDIIDDVNLNNQKAIKIEYKKIYCHKEMTKLAKNNGYDYKWSNGSHNIYEHNSTKKIVVIPSHDLGIGLSLKIQKQITNNAV